MHPQLLPRVAAYRQDDLIAEARRAREGGHAAGRRGPRRWALRTAVGSRLIEIGWRLVQAPRTGA